MKKTKVVIRPKNKLLKRLGIIALSFVLGCMLIAITARLKAQCTTLQSTLTPLPPSKNITKITATIPHYTRPEESTYLTFPEWYIVYSAQEYSSFIATRWPSEFPYLAEIGQYWCGYSNVYHLTRNHYPVNYGDHLMLVVIGVSYSGELAIKGLYENTLGRINEWLSLHHKTAEDLYSQQVAKEYGDFLPQTPWFDFPFAEKLVGLWTKTPLFGPYPLRKLERKISLSTEYGIKAVYGALIRKATGAIYSDDITETISWMDTPSKEILTAEPMIKIIKPIDSKTAIVSLPRFTEFNRVVPILINKHITFYEIAGNDEIQISILTNRSWKAIPTSAQVLFSMNILTNEAKKRVVLRVPVKNLSQTLGELQKQGTTLEHIYEY